MSNNNNELLASYKVFSLLEKASDNAEFMLDNMPGMFVVVTKDLKVVRSNREFAAIAGFAIDDVLGFDLKTLFSPENTLSLLRYLAPLQTGNTDTKNIEFELEIIAPHLKTVTRQCYWQASMLSLKNSAYGDLISITGKDISDLYQTEMKLQSIFSNLPLSVLLIGSDGKIKEVLSQFSEVIFNSNKLVGTSFVSLFKNAKGIDNDCSIDGLINIVSCLGKNKSSYSDAADSLPRAIAIHDKYRADIKWVSIGCQPIMKSGVVDGFIVMIEDATETVATRREMDRVSELERQIQTVYETAIRDPLTGLYTRLFMKESLKNITSNFHREHINGMAILIMDVDHFKRINDTHGHGMGDKVLSEIGRVILNQIRDKDIAIRYGGEEFLIVLPSNLGDINSGKIVAERIRQEVANLKFELTSGEVVTVTISGGAAWCNKDEHIDAAIERADGHLYEAKRLGRNCIVSERTGA